MPDLSTWLSIGSLVVSALAGIFVAKANQRSQSEANQINGTGDLLGRQNAFMQDIQEERDAAKADLRQEKETNKGLIEAFRKDFDDFRVSVEEEFSGYRTYIDSLRGQIYDLGAVPLKWPEKLRK